ncbi:MAG: ATP-binding cassette domain-containing protein, partial [Ignavibacteria bacterium]|nr:ATP-binding cassette domain-containing protein [Ignavibacteria bacterium]
MTDNQKNIKISTENLNLFYGRNHALKDINSQLESNKVTALIGPSGCGKSTFLRTLNRMNDLIAGVKITGTVKIDDKNIYEGGFDVVNLRRNVGMVFQKSNAFPKSIFENVAYGARINGIKKKEWLD